MSKWIPKRLREVRQDSKTLSARERHGLFADWFDYAPDAVLLIQAKKPYRIIEANTAACRLLGYERSELVKLSPRQIVSRDVSVQDLQLQLQSLLRQRQHPLLWNIRTKNGQPLPVEINCRLVGSNRGERLIFTEARDMTERLRMAQDLEQTEHIFDSLFDHNPDGVGVFDLNGRFVRANRTMGQMLGFGNGELFEQPLLSLVPEEQLLTAMQQLSRIEEGKPVGFDSALLHKQGYRVDVHLTAVPIWANERVNGYIVICKDITERKRTEEQNRYLAFFDDRTGLPNRRLFRERLQDALQASRLENRRIAVLYLDVDRFKLVNDSFGHDYGDILLMHIAERLQRCLSDSDVLARTEGDEFALFFTGILDKEDVPGLVSKVEGTFIEPFTLGEFQIHVTVSKGIALSEADEEDAEALMKHADIALSLAKEKGNSKYLVFNADMKSLSLQKLTLENDLRKALAEGQFLLYYQPQVETGSGRIVGVESLLRWKHPEKGMVPPKDFIPFAEETGLIGPIGEWVLIEACRQNKRWQESGFPFFPISVNLSATQFMQSNLRSRIAQVLEETGLEARYLELEITESMTMDVEHATNLLLELKQLGVQVSIDDFGTGYSSLYYLKKFPIDKLKIDQSFVRDIMTDPNDAAIVATIISMTHHLNLRVIAEGVETEEQLHFLSENRCNEVQGYWFSPPVPASRLEDLLVKHGQAAAAKE